MKDDYKKLSKEWGSKSRKADSRAAKSALRKPTREDLGGLEEPRSFRLPMSAVNYAIASYDTISPTDVLRLAKALKDAYEDLAEAEAQLVKAKTYERMANPPGNCERCQWPIDEGNRQWDGTSWHCDTCAKECQQ